MLLGVIYAVLGPALPRLSERFGLSATGAALLLSLNSGGALLGVLAAGALSTRFAAVRRSMIALVLIAAGCLGLGVAPTLMLALLAAGLLGLGFGMLDLSLNVWLATGYGDRSAAMLNLLSAGFGVGAVLAPLAVGGAGGDYRPLLLGCAVFAAMLSLALLMLPAAPDALKGVPLPPPRVRLEAGRARLVLGGFILLFLGYVAVESGVGAWEVTHLKDTLGLATGEATRISALFWVSFALGRLLAVPLALRLPPAQLVTGALMLAAASLALAAIPAAAPAAYTLAGLFLAPVFTTALVWLGRELPGGAAPTFVFAGAFLGPVIFSPVVGLMRDTFGPAAIPLTLLAIALLDIATVLALRRLLRA